MIAITLEQSASQEPGASAMRGSDAD